MLLFMHNVSVITIISRSYASKIGLHISLDNVPFRKQLKNIAWQVFFLLLYFYGDLMQCFIIDSLIKHDRLTILYKKPYA